MLELEHKQIVLRGLKELHRIVTTDIETIPRSFMGICFNLNELIGDVYVVDDELDVEVSLAYTTVSDYCEGWKHDTGVSDYPVPDTKSEVFWEGENFTLRVDLIEYIINKLEEEINS